MQQNSLPHEQHHPATTTDSFETLYSQYVNKVFQKCLSMTNDSETAQDYTQDIFIKAFTKLDRFQSRSAISTWLYAIAHNYCLDQLRLGKRFSTEALSNELTNSFKDAEDAESTHSSLQRLEGMLDQLPPDEVMLLRLKHEQGLSIKELSDRYQLTESAVKMRLKRSRDKLVAMYADFV
jgi:RNA polymerase sigma factor (sigma-70 family)